MGRPDQPRRRNGEYANDDRTDNVDADLHAGDAGADTHPAVWPTTGTRIPVGLAANWRLRDRMTPDAREATLSDRDGTPVGHGWLADQPPTGAAGGWHYYRPSNDDNGGLIEYDPYSDADATYRGPVLATDTRLTDPAHTTMDPDPVVTLGFASNATTEDIAFQCVNSGMSYDTAGDIACSWSNALVHAKDIRSYPHGDHRAYVETRDGRHRMLIAFRPDPREPDVAVIDCRAETRLSPHDTWQPDPDTTCDLKYEASPANATRLDDQLADILDFHRNTLKPAHLNWYADGQYEQPDN